MKIEFLEIYLGESDGWYADEGFNYYRCYKPCDALKEKFPELQHLQFVEHDLQILFDRNLNEPIILEIINSTTKKVILNIRIITNPIFKKLG